MILTFHALQWFFIGCNRAPTIYLYTFLTSFCKSFKQVYSSNKNMYYTIKPIIGKFHNQIIIFSTELVDTVNLTVKLTVNCFQEAKLISLQNRPSQLNFSKRPSRLAFSVWRVCMEKKANPYIYLTHHLTCFAYWSLVQPYIRPHLVVYSRHIPQKGLSNNCGQSD